jgi:monooxygenase
MSSTPSHVDVLIVGAGISGIGAAVHLQRECPGKTFTIIEGRANIGGTWDLFRYPGIRSDSDMYTLGFSFKPWTQPKAIADGPSIKQYLLETVDEHNLEPLIKFQTKVKKAQWDSAAAQWTVTLNDETGPVRRDEQVWRVDHSSATLAGKVGLHRQTNRCDW